MTNFLEPDYVPGGEGQRELDDRHVGLNSDIWTSALNYNNSSLYY